MPSTAAAASTRRATARVGSREGREEEGRGRRPRGHDAYIWILVTSMTGFCPSQTFTRVGRLYGDISRLTYGDRSTGMSRAVDSAPHASRASSHSHTGLTGGSATHRIASLFILHVGIHATDQQAGRPRRIKVGGLRRTRCRIQTPPVCPGGALPSPIRRVACRSPPSVRVRFSLHESNRPEAQ